MTVTHGVLGSSPSWGARKNRELQLISCGSFFMCKKKGACAVYSKERFCYGFKPPDDKDNIQ